MASVAQGGMLLERVAAPPALQQLGLAVNGRVLVAEDATASAFGGRSYTYQWPGTGFTARFRGQAVYFEVGAGHQKLHVTVDAEAPLIVVPEAGIYRVAGLAPGLHTVRVQVSSESQAGPDSFLGFAVAAGSHAEPPPVEPSRQIEFIGDSYTVGYGNTSPTRECTKEEIWQRTDDTQGFPAVIAGHFGAAYQVNAISGRGMVRNYDNYPGDPLPVAYPYTLFAHTALYDDASWHPQVIVIGLGTNDFSTALHAGEPWKTRDALHADFEATYVRFLEQLRAHDSAALFILWATDGENGEMASEAEKVVARMRAAGEQRIDFVEMHGLAMSACQGHPSTTDDRVIAAMLEQSMTAHHAW